MWVHKCTKAIYKEFEKIGTDRDRIQKETISSGLKAALLSDRAYTRRHNEKTPGRINMIENGAGIKSEHRSV